MGAIVRHWVIGIFFLFFLRIGMAGYALPMVDVCSVHVANRTSSVKHLAVRQLNTSSLMDVNTPAFLPPGGSALLLNAGNSYSPCGFIVLLTDSITQQHCEFSVFPERIHLVNRDAGMVCHHSQDEIILG